MLSMYQLLAIQIVERLHDLFIATVGETLGALGHTSIQPAACDSFSSMPGSVESTPPRGKGAYKKRGRLSPSDMQGGRGEIPREEVLCMWIVVRSLLQRSQLRVLDAGEQLALRSSAVLLRGSLTVASDTAATKRPKRLPCTATAPCVLVWAPTWELYAEGGVPVCAGVPRLLCLSAYD
jgi:hypothetical protein